MRAGLVIFTFLCMAEATAQSKMLSLRYGYGLYTRQDLTFSPFIHQDGSPLNLGLTYTRAGQLYQFADLSLASFDPILVPSYTYDDDEQTLPHAFLLVNLTYALGKTLPSSRPDYALTIGGFVESDIQPSTYNYAGWSNFGYLASFNLGAWIQSAWTFDTRHHVAGRLMIPLLSWMCRSPYLVNDDEYIENTASHNGVKTFFAYVGDGSLQTLNRMQQLAFLLDYGYDISGRWRIGAAYEARYMFVAKPNHFRSYRNTLFICGSYAF